MTLFLRVLFHCLILYNNKICGSEVCVLIKFAYKISVSKTNLMLAELKQPVIVCLKISTALLDVGSAIITRDIYLSIQPLNVLAELHFLWLNPY